METLLDQAPASGARSGTWELEQTVADLARELLKLSDGQLRSLRSLATAASEPRSPPCSPGWPRAAGIDGGHC